VIGVSGKQYLQYTLPRETDRLGGGTRVDVLGASFASAPLCPNPRSFGLKIWVNCRQEWAGCEQDKDAAN
jgi:hypothetical protein